MESFTGIEGRLEFLREVGGVKIYNDNNATTPTATIAALEAVSDYKNGQNVVAIVGGTDKGTDLSKFVDTIEKHVKHLVLYNGSGTEELKKVLPDTIEYEEYEVLSDCVEAAYKACENGDVLLFSPAFSSFGKHYINEYDRNDQFTALIEAL